MKKPLAHLICITLASASAIQSASLELRDGDRVALIGGTFIEREAKASYIETYLTLAHPDKKLTFRNLGWSADTVRGESRGYFKPEKGYEELLQKASDTKPTLIVLAYGANEAWAGEAGLDAFLKDYGKLIDDLSERTSARITLLSTLRQDNLGEPFPRPDAYNRNLKLYFDAIGKMADDRSIPYVDLFTQIPDVKGADVELHPSQRQRIRKGCPCTSVVSTTYERKRSTSRSRGCLWKVPTASLS